MGFPIVNPQRKTGQEKTWTIELWKIRLLACLTTLYFVWVSVNNGGFYFSIKHDILGRHFASFCLLGWAWIPDGNLAGGKGPGRKISWTRGGGKGRGGGNGTGGKWPGGGGTWPGGRGRGGGSPVGKRRGEDAGGGGRLDQWSPTWGEFPPGGNLSISGGGMLTF